MDWSDERYVKLYTRRTATTTLWPWQARALFPWLMAAANGSGIVEHGRHNRVEAICALTLLPREVVDPGLSALIADGTLEELTGAVVISNFVEAQEARKTEAAKKRDQRERARDQARDIWRAPVPRCPALSPDVPQCPPPAQPSPAQPSPAQPSPINNTVEQARPAEPLALELQATPTPEPAELVFEHWRATMKKPRAVFSADRKRAVSARLKEGYSADDLKQAVTGCSLTPHNQGVNDRGQRYDDLELICRNGANVERFMANATAPPKTSQREMAKAGIDWRSQQVYTSEPGEEMF